MIKKIQSQLIGLDELKSETILAYSVVKDLYIINRKIETSILDGSFFRDCVFIEASFTHSDLNATRFENCSFNNVNFSDCDIQSSIFSKCSFAKCSFKSSSILNCTFKEVEFIECDFQYSSFSQSNIINSNFKKANFKHSLTQLNRFYHCFFGDTVLGNASFCFNIMKMCCYQNVAFGINNVAFLYGIQLSDVKNSKLVYLGKKQIIQNEKDDNFLKMLIQSYNKRKLYFGVPLLFLNFTDKSVYECLEGIVDLIHTCTQGKILLKYTEISYITMILEELSVDRILPLITLKDIINALEYYEQRIHGSQKFLSEISVSKFKCLNIYGDIITKLFESISKIENASESLNIECFFLQKPEISIHKFLDEINLQYGAKYKVIEERYGSYIVSLIGTFNDLKDLLIVIAQCAGLIKLIVNITKTTEKLLSDSSLLVNNKRESTGVIPVNQISDIKKTKTVKKICSLSLKCGFSTFNLKKISVTTESNR